MFFPKVSKCQWVPMGTELLAFSKKKKADNSVPIGSGNQNEIRLSNYRSICYNLQVKYFYP